MVHMELAPAQEYMARMFHIRFHFNFPRKDERYVVVDITISALMMIIAMFHNSSLVIIVLVYRNIDVRMCVVYAQTHAGVVYCG